MTPPILQIESSKVEKKLDEVISSGIEASEKSATTFEKLEPVADKTNAFGFAYTSTELVLLIRIVSNK